MKHLLPVSLIACVMLFAGCGKSAATSKNLMENPLYAARYWSEMTDQYVQMLMSEKDKLTEAGEFASIESKRDEALENAKKATAFLKEDSVIGRLVPVSNDAQGIVLVKNNTLYFGSEFLSQPTPDAHVYLTEIIDPRDAVFPDHSSEDLGQQISPYGAQQYDIPKGVAVEKMKTAVLYDKELQRIIGFAQLQVEP